MPNAAGLTFAGEQNLMGEFVMLVLVILLILFVLAVVYPYAIYPLLLRLLPAIEVTDAGPRPNTVSLLFSAYNEGSALAEKLQNIEVLKRRYAHLEVLAYDDGSSDDTLERLRSRPDLVTVIEGVGRRGKAYGMKQMAGLAKGDVLVFTDANVTLDTDAIDHLLDWYRDPLIGGVCGTLRYLDSTDTATASIGGAYWRLEEKLKSLESRSGNVMGADGSIFSLRRELYPDFPDTVLDDLTVSMAAVFANRRLVKGDDVIAYERLVSARGDEFARKMRIAARAFHTHLYLRPQLHRMSAIDRFKYCSRKVVRWFGGLFLGLAALLCIAITFIISFWAGLVIIAISSGAVMAGLRVHRGIIAQVAEIVLALMATLYGVFQAMRGHTMTTWSPAKSR